MAQRDQIDIFVAGAPCSGKSTVVAIIRKALLEAGFAPERIECLGDSPVNEEKVAQVVKNGMTTTKINMIETTYGAPAKKEGHSIAVRVPGPGEVNAHG